MKRVKKLSIPKKKTVALLVLVILASVAVFIVVPRDNLSEEEKQQVAESEKILKEGNTELSISTNSIMEVDSATNNEEYESARNKVYEILERENLAVSEKRSAYAELSELCLPLEDLECADRVIAYQQEDGLLDYYFIVDMARLAKKLGELEKASSYYLIVYEDIQANGGKKFIEEANAASEQSLNYKEIKEGAGQ